METAPLQPDPVVYTRAQFWMRVALAIGLLWIFLCGITGLGSGFKALGKDALTMFFEATDNPFVGLVVGILGTTMVQSSSVSTSMIVAMVAAPENPLPIANAVPMIMGANIGTTVTNTVVALGHIGRPDEFKRAFSAATCHDFFNFMTVAVLLPLELFTGVLTRLSGGLTELIGVGGGGKLPNPLKASTKYMVKQVQGAIEVLTGDEHKLAAVLLIVASVGLIFVSLLMIVRVLRSLAGGHLQGVLTRSLDAAPALGIVVGAILTVMVQSSSITTSVMVPLAGAGIITLQQVFPITLGANIGTTFTALLATMATPSETAHLAVQIALVHLLFNVLGLLMVFPWPRIREIPLNAARRLANLAVRSRKLAVAYVLGLFYGLPALLITISKLF